MIKKFFSLVKPKDGCKQINFIYIFGSPFVILHSFSYSSVLIEISQQHKKNMYEIFPLVIN